MATIHKRARAALQTLREKNTDQTQELAYFVRSILGTFKDNAKNPKHSLKMSAQPSKEKEALRN
jgi:hypothetical protein